MEQSAVEEEVDEGWDKAEDPDGTHMANSYHIPDYTSLSLISQPLCFFTDVMKVISGVHDIGYYWKLLICH